MFVCVGGGGAREGLLVLAGALTDSGLIILSMYCIFQSRSCTSN